MLPALIATSYPGSTFGNVSVLDCVTPATPHLGRITSLGYLLQSTSIERNNDHVLFEVYAELIEMSGCNDVGILRLLSRSIAPDVLGRTIPVFWAGWYLPAAQLAPCQLSLNSKA